MATVGQHYDAAGCELAAHLAVGPRVHPVDHCHAVHVAGHLLGALRCSVAIVQAIRRPQASGSGTAIGASLCVALYSNLTLLCFAGGAEGPAAGRAVPVGEAEYTHARGGLPQRAGALSGQQQKE